jgi:hypothetical protein
MPVGAKFPVPGKTVHVAVGDPIQESDLQRLRKGPENTDTYQALSSLAMDHIAQLRPAVLASYMGHEAAARLLIEETQMARAMNPALAASGSTDHPTVALPESNRPVADLSAHRRAN